MLLPPDSQRRSARLLRASAAPAVPSSSSNLRSGLVYAVVAGVQRASSFLLLPFLTRAISPAEYGILSVILSAAAASSIVFACGLDVAILRTYFALADDPAAQRRYIDSAWLFQMVAPIAGAAILLPVLLPVASAGSVDGGELALGLFGAAVFAAASTVPMATLRAQERTGAYALTVGAMTVGSTAAVTVLVLVADLGISGWLAGVALGNLVGLATALVVVPWGWPAPFDRSRLLSSLVLGLPLLPHALSQWALQLADRLVLSGLVGNTRLGIYSLAANFSVPAFVLVLGINQGLMPGYARAAHEPHGVAQLASLAVVQATAVVTSCTALALLVPGILLLVVDADYAGASELVGWMTLGYLFLGLYYIPMDWLTLTAGRTQRVWLITAACAVTNLGLLYLLVPSHGIVSAAVASAVGYLVLLLGMGGFAKRMGSPVRYDWSRLARLGCIAAATYAAATLTTDGMSDLASLGLRGVWVLVMVGGLLAARVVSVAALRGVMRR